ncbi:MAG TPA: response regulator transcription factor [Chloroflexota bacterium]|nr:response regulator transcription factor [Chloroflexota bacterium]
MRRVFLVDDEAAVRAALRKRLALEPDMSVVGEASSADEALDLVPTSGADVVLMDVAMSDMDGIAATRALRDCSPRASVIVLTIHDTDRTRAQARDAGAVTCIGKHEPIEVLLGAIRRARPPGS